MNGDKNNNQTFELGKKFIIKTLKITIVLWLKLMKLRTY